MQESGFQAAPALKLRTAGSRRGRSSAWEAAGPGPQLRAPGAETGGARALQPGRQHGGTSKGLRQMQHRTEVLPFLVIAACPQVGAGGEGMPCHTDARWRGRHASAGSGLVSQEAEVYLTSRTEATSSSSSGTLGVPSGDLTGFWPGPLVSSFPCSASHSCKTSSMLKRRR